MSRFRDVLGGALVFNLAHEPANVLPGVPGQLDHLALPDARLHGVGHRLREDVEGLVVALLCGVLAPHCLPQGGNGLFGGGHVDMFAHLGGHTEARSSQAFSILACGHMYVASWMCASDP